MWTFLTLREDPSMRTRLLEICKHKTEETGLESQRITDICLVGSRAFPPELHKYISPGSDADIVILVPRIPFLDRRYISFIFEDVKCVLQFRLTHMWFGYDMPYYSIMHDFWYCPEDWSGIWYQFWRKKVRVEQTDDPKPVAPCTLCGKQVSFTDDFPTYGRVLLNGKHRVHRYLFLCEECADKLLVMIGVRAHV